MKRHVAMAFLMIFACAGDAHGQTVMTTTPGQPQASWSFFLADQQGHQLAVCDLDSKGEKVTKCTLQEGSTLEEIVQAVYDDNKWMMKTYVETLENTNNRLNKCLSIAERENKSLRKCADSLQQIGESLGKLHLDLKP